MIGKYFLRWSVCFLLLAIGVWAQTTGGSISGNVTDASGAAIPGATVTATNQDTGVVNKTESNAVGAYNFPALPVGTYTLTSTRTGFQTYKQTGITLSVHESLRQDLKLAVGAQNQTVEVSATAVHVNTSTTQMGDVIAGSSITAQPLNGRSYVDLLGLQPGVNPPSSGGTNGTISISGSRTDTNGFTVNGGSVEEGRSNGTSIIPDLDSIAEFRVITNGADAEYGHFSGGQVSVVTKSGTNKFHGDLFEFFRNQKLDANNYFNNLNGVAKGAYKRNQFGGTLGGPILHNKLFFFADYQGTRITQGISQQVNVPSDGSIAGSSNELNGDLSDRASDFYAYQTGTTTVDPKRTATVSSPYLASVLSHRLGYAVNSGEYYYTPGCASNGATQDTACVFPAINGATGPFIPKAAWDPTVANFLALVPAANGTSNGLPAFVTSANNEETPDNKGSVRLDYNSRLGMLSGYYFIDNSNDMNPYGNASLPGYNTASPRRAQQFNLGLTSILGPDMVNEFHLNFVRDYSDSGIALGGVGTKISSFGFASPASCAGDLQPGTFANCDGLLASNAAMEGVPYVSTNDWSLGTAVGGTIQADNTFEYTDTFAITHGNHQFKFGGQAQYTQINERNIYGSNGQFAFDGTQTGDDLADFLIGTTDEYTQASFQVLDSRAWYYGWFAQDTWRVTPSFTLDYGLRWEVSPFFYDTQNKIQTYEPGVNSSQYPGAPTGFVFPGDPNIPRTLAPTSYKNFAPRLGFAWSPSADGGVMGLLFGGAGRSSIRGAWGMYYTDVADSSLFVEVADAPFGLYWDTTGGQFLSQPWLQTDGSSYGQHFPFSLPTPGDPNINWNTYLPISSSPGLYYRDRLPYTENYNFSYERQIGNSTVLDLAYVGSQGHRLLVATEINPGIPSLCQALSDPANLAPGTTVCGPGNENNVYPLSSAGQTALGTTATTIYGTRAPLGINFGANNLSMDTMGNSTYNSLQAGLRHTSGRFTYQLGYTYGKAMDNASSGGFGGNVNPYNYGLSHSLSNYDITHNFVASYNYELPFDQFWGANRLTSGWRIAGTTRLTTGTPIALSYGIDNSLLGTGGVDRPMNLLNGQKLQFNNPRENTEWVANGGALFGPEPLGAVGDANRAFFHGPGLVNTDLTLMKDIRTTETQSIQVRFDAFNVFNHENFTNPSGRENSRSFLQINSGRDPRIAQVAVKYIF